MNRLKLRKLEEIDEHIEHVEDAIENLEFDLAVQRENQKALTSFRRQVEKISV